MVLWSYLVVYFYETGAFMRILGILVLFSCFATFPVSAGVLNVVPGTKIVEGVTVAQEAHAKLADRVYYLKGVGAGLRYKKVALFKANIYVGELLLDAPEKFQRTLDGALPSLSQQKVIAMRMTFLRDVDGEKVSNSFREALLENKVKLDSPGIIGFLNAVKSGGEAKEKTTVLVLGERLQEGKEAVTFESSSGKLETVLGEAGLLNDIFSIWLGKIDDSGLENLRNEILGVKK